MEGVEAAPESTLLDLSSADVIATDITATPVAEVTVEPSVISNSDSSAVDTLFDVAPQSVEPDISPLVETEIPTSLDTSVIDKTDAVNTETEEENAELLAEVHTEAPIFDFLNTSETVEIPTSLDTSVIDKTDAVNTETEEQFSADLFGNISENSESVSEIKTEEVLPSSTLDFLTAGLTQLDAMEKMLLDRKEKFLAQAEKYRLEKEKFAELEAQAIKDSTTMDDEQARIATMRNYFQAQQKKQKDGSEITESVNTALTGMSVKNAVGKAMKPRTRSKQTASV